MITLLQTSFEDTFIYHQGISELEVPPGWLPVWVQGTQPGINHRPEYKPEDTRIHSGEQAAKIFTTHASHDACLAKVVAIPPEQHGKVWVSAWGATFGIRAGHALQIGMDPAGGVDFPSQRIIWSQWWGQYQPDWAPEKYHQFEVGVLPQSNLMTVFLHSKSDYAAQTVAAYWDDVLVQQEGDEPGPGPTPEVDYERIRQIVQEVIAEREPVRWPR